MSQQIQLLVDEKFCQSMQIYIIFKSQNFSTVKTKIPIFMEINFKIAIIFAQINFPFSFDEIGTLVMITHCLGMKIFFFKVVFLAARHPVKVFFRKSISVFRVSSHKLHLRSCHQCLDQ